MTTATHIKKPRPKILVLWNRGEEAGAITPSPRQALAQQVTAALRLADYRVALHNLEDDVDRITDAVVVEQPDLVFHLIDQFYGDDIAHPHVLSYLWLLGVPYAGGDPLCLFTAQDRSRVHLMLRDASVPVPGFAVIRDVNAIPDTSELCYPLIVTQALDDIYEDEGIERPIYSRIDLEDRVAELAKEYEMPYLVEEYLGERRVHAIVMGNRMLEVLPLVELHYGDEEHAGSDEDDAGHNDDNDESVTELEPAAAAEEAFDAQPSEADASYEAIGDYLDEEDAYATAEPRPEGLALAQLEPGMAGRLRQLAQRAFRAMGCRDVAQVDLHLDSAGGVWVIDVRPQLELGIGSPFAIAAAATERGWHGAIARIAQVAAERARIADPAFAPAAEAVTSATDTAPPASSPRRET